jgi:hypothetical protein
MNAALLDATDATAFRLSRTLSWQDSDTGCTIVVAQPSSEPELWADYLQGAQHSYRKHGVECALDFDAIRDGHDTTLFYTAVDDTGRVTGGLRAKGPYQCADESHALVEWVGHPGQQAVAKMITDRLPFGVVEMKTAWVTDDRDRERNRVLTKTFARTALPTMALLDVQFVMATAAAYVLDSWASSGGVVATKIPAAPYPDERYRTKIMWWDRRTLANHAEPKQLSKTLAETRELAQDCEELSEFGMGYGSGG